MTVGANINIIDSVVHHDPLILVENVPFKALSANPKRIGFSVVLGSDLDSAVVFIKMVPEADVTTDLTGEVIYQSFQGTKMVEINRFSMAAPNIYNGDVNLMTPTAVGTVVVLVTEYLVA